MKDPYRRIARFYDAVVEPFNAALRRYVLKVARPREGLKVVEIGCGTGTNLELFADAGCEVAGVDLVDRLDLAPRVVAVQHAGEARKRELLAGARVAERILPKPWSRLPGRNQHPVREFF